MARFKKGSKEAREYMAKIRKKKTSVGKVSSKRQTGVSNRKRDKLVQAKEPGKRIAKKTKSVYYERRANRSDKGTLLGVGNIELHKVGSELLALEFEINVLKDKKKKTKLVNDKKKIQSKISVLQSQFKTLKAYLNSRAKFVSK